MRMWISKCMQHKTTVTKITPLCVDGHVYCTTMTDHTVVAEPVQCWSKTNGVTDDDVKNTSWWAHSPKHSSSSYLEL